MPATVLVVDDERNIQLTLSRALSMEGYAVEVAGGGREALEKIAALPVDVVLMDVRMPDLDGLSVLEKARETRPELPFVIMSGHGSIETVLSSFKLGAFDYLEKPITEKEKLVVAVRNALAMRSLREENAALRREAGPLEMVGGGPAMKKLFDVIRPTAPSEGRVLVNGENGTGKALVAPEGGPVREAELRGGAGGAHRERAVRARARRVHGCDRGAPRPVRAGGRRHAVPRRGRGHAALDAGEGAARPAGGRVRARRRAADAPLRRARRRRDEQGPRRGGEGWAVPRGPLLPAQRRADQRAAPPRAARGRAGARHALPRRGLRAERPPADAPRARGPARAAGARVAGERSRAEEPRRAARDPLGRPGDRRRRRRRRAPRRAPPARRSLPGRRGVPRPRRGGGAGDHPLCPRRPRGHRVRHGARARARAEPPLQEDEGARHPAGRGGEELGALRVHGSRVPSYTPPGISSQSACFPVARRLLPPPQDSHDPRRNDRFAGRGPGRYRWGSWESCGGGSRRRA